MTYKGEEIGIPTEMMIYDYIVEMNYAISARKVYRHYCENGWTDSNGKPITKLEAAVNGCNSALSIYSPDNGELPEPYRRLLDDPRWREFSKKVKIYYQNTCQNCGKKGLKLEAHHKVYYMNKKSLAKMPWEYDMDDMTALCSECHKQAHNVRYINRV